MAKNLLDLIDIDLLAYFKTKLDLVLSNKVDKIDGKGLSTNDYTSDEKTKLANIATGAQVNVIEGIQVAGSTISPVSKIVNIPAATQSAAGAMSAADKNKLDGVATGAQVNVIESVKKNGSALTITNKTVDISVPTRVTDLSDESNYATKTYVDQNGGKIDKIKVNGVEQAIASSDKSVDLDIDDIFWIEGSATVTYDPDIPEVITAFTFTPSDSELTQADISAAIALGKYPIIRAEDQDEIKHYIPLIENSPSHFYGQIGYNGHVNILLMNRAGTTSWHCTVSSGPFAYTDFPEEDGTADPGSSADYARGDHVHPHDSTKVDKVTGKGLSTNDYTTTEKNKLAGIAAGAQVNVIESIKKNGTALTITGKAVDISVPTKTSDITNDSGFITIEDVPEGAAGTTTTPKMDGTATVGTETAFARGDHVHPHDTTKVDKVDGKGLSTNDYTTTEKNKLAGIAAGAQVNVVTDASSSGSGASQTMSVSKGSTTYTTYTKAALDTSLGTKADASTVYTKTEIDQKLSGAMDYKGTKATVADLPSSGNKNGDVWHVTADGGEYAWNGSAWEELGSVIDLSGYVEDDDLGLATTADIDALFA